MKTLVLWMSAMCWQVGALTGMAAAWRLHEWEFLDDLILYCAVAGFVVGVVGHLFLGTNRLPSLILSITIWFIVMLGVGSYLWSAKGFPSMRAAPYALLSLGSLLFLSLIRHSPQVESNPGDREDTDEETADSSSTAPSAHSHPNGERRLADGPFEPPAAD